MNNQKDVCMNGVGGVARVTMFGKLGFTYERGMAVALTGENEVGPGAAAGSSVFGVVTKVEESLGEDGLTPTQIILGVQTAGFHDGVRTIKTVGSRPLIGSVAVCNDKGELIKVPDPAPAGLRGIVTSVSAVLDEPSATVVF